MDTTELVTTERWRLSRAEFLVDESALVTYEWPVALVFGVLFLGMAIHLSGEARQVAAVATKVAALAPAQRSAVLARLDAGTRDRLETLLEKVRASESWTGAPIEDVGSPS